MLPLWIGYGHFGSNDAWIQRQRQLEVAPNHHGTAGSGMQKINHQQSILMNIDGLDDGDQSDGKSYARGNEKLYKGDEAHLRFQVPRNSAGKAS